MGTLMKLAVVGAAAAAYMAYRKRGAPGVAADTVGPFQTESDSGDATPPHGDPLRAQAAGGADAAATTGAGTGSSTGTTGSAVRGQGSGNEAGSAGGDRDEPLAGGVH